jgi:hypothetical protein
MTSEQVTIEILESRTSIANTTLGDAPPKEKDYAGSISPRAASVMVAVGERAVDKS